MSKPQFKCPGSLPDNLKAGEKKSLERHTEVFKRVVFRKLGRKVQKSSCCQAKRSASRERGRSGNSDGVSQKVSIIAPELSVVQCVLQQPSKLGIYFVCFLKLGLF